MAKLTHADDEGNARMVDVGSKRPSRRRAKACGRVRFNQAAYDALRANRLSKGDAVGVARIAGIQAAKRTAEWVPLCHAVPLDHVDVSVEFDDGERCAVVVAEASATWTTGVEMEALTAVHAACLALYDMAKALDRGIVVERVLLLEKSGGRSGDWRREGGVPE